MKKRLGPEAIDPKTGRSIPVKGLRAETGVYIHPDGVDFSDRNDVVTWQRAVETMGLFRAVLHFFDRENLPQVK